MYAYAFLFPENAGDPAPGRFDPRVRIAADLYNWALTKNKPIMVAEWAVYECKTTCDPNEKAKLHATVVPQLKGMPAIKALVAFDTASDQQGLDMRIDSTPQALSSFQKIAADPMFEVRVR